MSSSGRSYRDIVVDHRTPLMLEYQNKILMEEVKLLRKVVWSLVYRHLGGRAVVPPLDEHFKHQLVTTTDENMNTIIEAK